MVSFETYRSAVRKALIDQCSYMPKADVEKYFKSDEAQNAIKAQYSDDVKQVEQGGITEGALTDGCAYSLAYCLALLMD